MAWMERGLQVSLKRYALSMEDKMAAGVLGAQRIMDIKRSVSAIHDNKSKNTLMRLPKIFLPPHLPLNLI